MRSRPMETAGRSVRLAGFAAVAAAAVAVSLPAGAIENPNDTGETGKKPFVLMVMDSSASMEWTTESAETYPERDYSPLGVGVTSDPYPSQPDAYDPEESDLDVDDAGEAARPSDYKSNPMMFGSCMVWEPPCSEYERPSWNPSSVWTSQYDTSEAMGRRFNTWMRGKASVFDSVSGTGVSAGDQLRFPVRLLNHTQPRHVTFKEILTGEMVLKPEGLRNKPVSDIDHRVYGPGCWLVPRQRGSRRGGEPICCREESADGLCREGYEAFERYPDHRDLRPHFQEVFDSQLGNGLMDNLSDEIFFGTAAFDSYKWPQDGNEYGDKNLDFEQTVDWPPNDLNDEIDGSLRGVRESDPGTYDLGIYRIAAPTTFEVPNRYMSDLSRYSQVSLLDAGTLKRGADDDSSFQLDPSSAPGALDFSFRAGLESYIGSTSEPFELSRQPISRSTPLAAAIHDIHEFFDRPSNVINEDRFKQCRPKHVMLMTDGVPIPERKQVEGEDGHCVDIPGATLSGAFGFDEEKYEYRCTEEMIRDFVRGEHGSSYMVGGGHADPEYDPRVHVIGLNRGGKAAGERTGKALEKLGSMARAGKTCAGFVLRDDSGGGPWIPTSSGECRRDDHPCLVPQPNEDFTFVSYADSTKTGTCEYPALVLRCNGDVDPPTTAAQKEDYRRCKESEWFSRAFQQMFNSILKSAGLASRTKPAITNRLDDPSLSAGGQYRLYSGVEVTEGNPFWQGVLLREKRLCSPQSGQLQQLSNRGGPCSESNDRFDCMHEQIDSQVGSDQNRTGRADGDTRRVFTTVPDEEVYDYDEDVSKPIDNASCGRFQSTYLLEDDGGRGEFQSSYLETNGGSTDDLLLHKRVPVAFETLRNALTGSSKRPRGKPLSGEKITDALTSYFKVASVGVLKTLVDRLRGHVPDRRDRVLGAVLHSDPVAVEPPSRDVPVDSYRDFKSKFADRPTMLYVSTLDGMLHAIHTGEMDESPDQIQARSQNLKPSNAGTNLRRTRTEASDQREAWAYVPHMLHDELSAQYDQGNPTLMDGTPVVKDVRLCHSNSKYNQNFQACRAVCESNEGNLAGMCSRGSTSCVPDAMQWRSVLVQGLGSAGSGYFAMDVTRPGGSYTDDNDQSVEPPDPIPLWEFDPSWEEGQIEHMVGSSFPEDGKDLVYPPESWRDGHDPTSDCSDEETRSDYFWKQSFMGESVGQPAVGTVVLPGLGDDADIKRPVAVFSGGGSADRGTCDIGQREGRAIYVVDLQTGTLLRRFVGYRDSSGWNRFEAQVMGSPTLFDNATGQLVTRGFVGDARGRLFRLDLSSSDPADWGVSLFFDPEEAFFGANSGEHLGPASLKPAVAMDRQQRLTVFYGLGEPGDSTPKGETQMLLAVRETEDAIEKNEPGDSLWSIRPDNLLKETEKITGDPVVFNQRVYFTSYYLEQGDLCSTGRSRIWGLEMSAPENDQQDVPDGTFNCSRGNLANVAKGRCTPRYFEPKDDTLVRGLTITLGPTCSLTGSDASSADFQASADRKPRLIAQTGSADPGEVGGTNPGTAKSGSVVNRVETAVDSPESQTIPLSWSVISQ